MDIGYLYGQFYQRPSRAWERSVRAGIGRNLEGKDYGLSRFHDVGTSPPGRTFSMKPFENLVICS